MYSVVLALSVVSVAVGYPQGPPVEMAGHDDLCKDMVPTGHGAEAQGDDVPVPYEYVFSSSCYKENMEVKVAIKANHEDPEKKYFEGFFVQVQEDGTNDANYGTFSTEDDEYSQTLKCLGTDESAIGQKAKAHFNTRIFTWKAPATGNKDLIFRSTIVKGKTTFWVNVKSAVLSYNDTCTMGSFTETATLQESDSHENGGKDANAAVSVLPGLFTAAAFLLCALIL